MDWLDLLSVQGTLKSLLQNHSSKASILQHSAFFTVQLSHPYMTTGKTTALTRRTFVDKVISLLLNMLSRLVITFFPTSKCTSESESESEVAQSCPALCDPMDSSLHQAPPFMRFSRQEYWSGLPFPFPGNLPNPGIEPRSPTLQEDSLPSELLVLPFGAAGVEQTEQ